MIHYSNITKQVALRANQIGDGADAADIETKYSDVLSTAIEGVELPLSALKMAILASEKSIAEICAFSSIDIYRSALYGRTDDLISGDEVGIRGDGNKEFVGAFANVRDSITDALLTEKPPQDIARYNRLYTDGFLVIRPHHFHKSGSLLYHTRDIAYLDGCLWDYDEQSIAYDTQDAADPDDRIPSPLAQACEVPWICHVLTHLPQENWFVPEASYYANCLQQWKAGLDRGVVSVPTLIDTTSSAEPVKN